MEGKTHNEVAFLIKANIGKKLEFLVVDQEANSHIKAQEKIKEEKTRLEESAIEEPAEEESIIEEPVIEEPTIVEETPVAAESDVEMTVDGKGLNACIILNNVLLTMFFVNYNKG